MKENKFDLKKVCTYAVIGYIIAVAVFSFAAWNKISASRVAKIYPILALLGLAIVAGYGWWLQLCEKKGKHSIGLHFINTIAKYWFLMEQLIQRDFKIKYKRSVLGIFWSFLNPLLMMLVQYVVFTNLFDLRGMGVVHYPIYLLSGIVTWNGFSDCTNQAMRAITGNASLITKVYVPKYIYPVTKVLSASINTILSMVPLLLVTIIYGLFNDLYLTPALLLLPIFLILLIVFIIGVSFLLSSLMVFFHDVEFLWGVISTMWMYATPIIYGIKILETKQMWLAKAMQFNPMYHYVEFIRSIIIYGTSPDLMEYVICAAFSFGSLLIGIIVFKKTQDKFILYI